MIASELSVLCDSVEDSGLETLCLRGWLAILTSFPFTSSQNDRDKYRGTGHGGSTIPGETRVRASEFPYPYDCLGGDWRVLDPEGRYRGDSAYDIINYRHAGVGDGPYRSGWANGSGSGPLY